MGGGWKGQERVKCIIGVNASVTFVWIQWMNTPQPRQNTILFLLCLYNFQELDIWETKS